jgi:guanylate kinase
MITTVIMLLTLCVGIIFIFVISVENLDRKLKKHESDNQNEMKMISHRFNMEFENVERLRVDLFKANEKNVLLEKRIAKLEIQILKLNNIDTSRSY